MQVLQGMPVLDPPPRLEPAPAPALGHALESATPILHMAAAAELLPLQPSKLNAYKLFTEQVKPGILSAPMSCVFAVSMDTYLCQVLAYIECVFSISRDR